MSTDNLYHGVLHGRIIELDSDPQLPDGERVTVNIHRSVEKMRESLRRACGAWKDMPGLDESIEEICESPRSDPR